MAYGLLRSKFHYDAIIGTQGGCTQFFITTVYNR